MHTLLLFLDVSGTVRFRVSTDSELYDLDFRQHATLLLPLTIARCQGTDQRGIDQRSELHVDP